MKLMLAGLLVGLLVCASEAEAQTAKTTSGCRSDFFAHATGHREIARAVARLEQEMRTRNIPGLQAAVVKQGQIVMLVSCGTADISFELPVVRTTRFQLASATKPFTGVAIMQLVEEGKIRLDNRLADYLENLPESWRSVTVRQALMHVSGLPDVIDPATGAVIDPAGFSAAWTKVLSAPMQFSPGRAYAYDQTNYLLLGRIIEKLRGEPFVEGVRRRQFAVADMPSATFSDAYSIVPGRATSYALRQMVDGVLTPRDTPQPNVFSYPKSLYTGAGVTASSEEVARWIIALRNDKLLSADKRKEMWTAGRMPDGAPTAWALGWPAFPREKHPAVAGIGGGSAAFYFYPEDDVGIVILTNLGGAQPQQFIEQVAEYYGSDPPA
jgi:CubicO group peptidase (beta-lactamase class C family)